MAVPVTPAPPVAAQTALASPQVRATSVRGVQLCGSGRCACPPQDEETLVQRDGGRTAPGAGAAPDSVHEALQSPGTALGQDTRSYFEPLFGHDFGAVRVHAEPSAQASAAQIAARAYTVGDDIVLGPGLPSQAVAPGSRLLAHELTHVVQQSGQPPATGRLAIGATDTPAENEADAFADRVSAGSPVRVTRQPGRAVRRALSCPELIQPDQPRAIAGIGRPAHDAIEEHARRQLGRRFWRQPIPGASFGAYRTEDRNPRNRSDPTADEQATSQTIGGRAGDGTPDLGFRQGGAVELAEVKPAILTYGTTGGLIEGEFQLANYVSKAMSEENRGWRGRRRIRSVEPMLPDRLTFPAQLTTSRGDRIRAGWCLPGLVGYRPLTPEETETIICGVSDHGAVDTFLDHAMVPAERMIGDYIDQASSAAARRIRRFTLREGIQVLSSHSVEGLKKLVVAVGPPGTEDLMDLVPEVELTDWAADFIADQLGGEQLEAMLRSLATAIKDQLFADVRAWLKNRIRTYLQEALNAACAAATVGAAVSIAALLRRFGQDLAQHFVDGLLDVARAWAVQMARALAKSVIVALLLAVAVALLIFFLPGILAGVAAVAEASIGAVAVGAGAAAAAGPRLIALIDQLVQAFLDAAPAL